MKEPDMDGLHYTLMPPDECGFQAVVVDLEPCPMCGAKHDSFHTRKVYMKAWQNGNYCNASVKCLNCGLNIKRTTEKPAGSLNESIRRVYHAWCRRAAE